MKKATKPKKPSIREQIIARAEAEMAETCNNYTQTVEQVGPNELLMTITDTPKDLVSISNACLRIGTKLETVQAYPLVTKSFESIGGPEKVIEYLRSSKLSEAKELIRLWDMYHQYRNLLPFEAYCCAATLTRKKLMSMVMAEVCEQSDVESTLLAAAAHPDVVKKTIAIAKSDDWGAGEARKLLHQNRGFLPQSKNTVIHGNVHQDNRQDNSQHATVNVVELDLANDKISKGVDRFNEARMISAGEPIEIEAELVEEDES